MNPAALAGAVPLWIKLVLGFELAITELFVAWSWSHTVGLAQGRAASLADIAALSLPLALVVLLGGAAIMLSRKGRRDWAALCAIAPWP
ncbi:MAG: hypothetical protein FJX31_01780, partial [Alphaproteobacteria bacterium]|nr:hypothetical protein [Alphaproteobacteria bacterium]